MERTAVKSKDLAIVGYDPFTMELEITFRGGGVYVYSKVPNEIYEGLMKAESHGTYFNKTIKDQFTAKKIN